ncbi:MAG: MFS transporter [Sphingomonadaceae bacterium]|nr:MFS transporter [Sphingomonadaceae bacterium]
MAEGLSRRQWLLVGLVFIAVALNYVDRQIIALLKPTLEAEFGWSNRDYGRMASAFQFSAAVAYLAVGWFLDRFGLRRGFAVGVGGWSLAAIAHAFAGSVGAFVGARAVLGAFEATGTPAAVKSAATYFQPSVRSLVIGIGNTAPNIGAVVAPLTIPAIALAVGWRNTFVIAGSLGLVWTAVWLAARLPEPLPQPPAPPREQGALIRHLGQRRQWALILAKVLSDQGWFFLLFFLPDFFAKTFGLKQGTVGGPVALVYLLAGLGAFTGGLLTSRLIARGLSMNAARKRALLIYALLVLPVPAVLGLDSPWSAALLLGLALFAHQGFSTNVFGLATDLFPARSVGLAIGIAAFGGNMGSVAVNEFAGWALDRGLGYAPMLWMVAVSYLAALAAVQAIVPRIPDREADSVPLPPGALLAH